MIVQSVFKSRRNAILTAFTLVGASVMMPLSSYAMEDDLPSVEIHLENLDSLQKVTPVPVMPVHTKPAHILKKAPVTAEAHPVVPAAKPKLPHAAAAIIPPASVKKEHIDSAAANVHVKKKMVEANAPTSGISRYLPLLPSGKETEARVEAQAIAPKTLNKPLKSEATAKASLFAVPEWVAGMGKKKKAELTPPPALKEKTKTTVKIAKTTAVKKKVAATASHKQTAKMERKTKMAAIAHKKEMLHSTKIAKKASVKKHVLLAKASVPPVKHGAAIPAKKTLVSNKTLPPIDDVVITETAMAEKPAEKSSLFTVPSWVPVIGEGSKQAKTEDLKPKALAENPAEKSSLFTVPSWVPVIGEGSKQAETEDLKPKALAENPTEKPSLFTVPSWVPVVGEASKQAETESAKPKAEIVPETQPAEKIDKKNSLPPVKINSPVKLAFESKKQEHPIAKKIEITTTTAKAVPVQKVTVTEVADATPSLAVAKPLPTPPTLPTAALPETLPVVAAQDAPKEAPIGLLIPGLPALPPPDSFQVGEKNDVKEEKYVATPNPAVASQPVAAPVVAPIQKFASIVPAPSTGSPMVNIPGGVLLLRLNYQEAVIAVPTEEKGRLADMVENVTKKKETHLSVVSYASGSEENIGADRRISLQRAIELRKNLIAEGIDSEKINVKAMGNNAKDGSKDHVDIFAIE